MGCDIHFVVERKVDNQWIGVYSTDLSPHLASSEAFKLHIQRIEKQPETYNSTEYEAQAPVMRSRNYRFFAALAGVRGDGPNPLGEPLDSSALTSLCLGDWGADGHSISHLPLGEFIEKWLMTTNSAMAVGLKLTDQATLRKLVGALAGNYVEMEHYRVVFWFDN